MSQVPWALRSALCSAIGILALVSARPLPAMAAKADEFSDIPAGILLTRAHLGDGPVVPQASNSAAGRPEVLAIRGFASIGKVMVAFTGPDLKPFYVLPGDCKGECLTKWHPVLVSGPAQPVGDWSIVTRDDGAKQWALRGKPLYTYDKEIEFKDNLHLTYTREPPGRMQQVAGAGIDGAAVAEADPSEHMKIPAGMSVLEFDQAPGMVLAASKTGQPIYAFSGSDEHKLGKDFRPYPASMMDQPVGDFKIRTRADGVRQWAFRGQPLFTYAGDVEPAQLNGKELIAGMAPAVVFKFFTPKEVALQKDERNWGRLVEAKTELSLYVRDRIYSPVNPTYLHGLNRLDPLVGKAVGIAGCDSDCEKEWKPLLASKDAQPHGDWTLYDRPDGTKQWAYRTYALYTHPSDPPGTAYGEETYDIAFDGAFGKKPAEVLGTGLIFRVALP